MKIFFSLALVNYFTWYVVLGDGCVDTSSSCGTFLIKDFGCGNSYVADVCKKSCELTCGDCGTGFTYTSKGLGGSTKEFTTPGEGIENCRKACLSRSGCTGFEYNHGGEEEYKCGTYTGGDANIEEGSQKSSWTSCILDGLKAGEACDDDSQCESGNCQSGCTQLWDFIIYYDCCA